MNRYTTRQVTGVTGIARHRVYALVSAGVLHPERNTRGHLHFGFRDLVILRAAQTLVARSVPPRRLFAVLRALHRQLPDATPLSALRIVMDGKHILARDRSTLFTPESGQTVLDFALDGLGIAVAPIDRPADRPREASPTADAWFERGLELEEQSRFDEAEQAYLAALDIQPRTPSALINLGRLLHARGALAEAESLYRMALEIEPRQHIAHFNLGVLLEDRGAFDEALQRYQAACSIEPGVSAIHNNLARLYRLRGDAAAADRHLACMDALRPVDEQD